MKKETTIIITTSITVQSESDVPQDEIVCSVKNALRVDNSKLLDSLTLMEEEQTDDELVSEHELSTVSQEDFNKAFNKAFNEILEGSTQRYLTPKTESTSAFAVDALPAIFSYYASPLSPIFLYFCSKYLKDGPSGSR